MRYVFAMVVVCVCVAAAQAAPPAPVDPLQAPAVKAAPPAPVVDVVPKPQTNMPAAPSVEGRHPLSLKPAPLTQNQQMTDALSAPAIDPNEQVPGENPQQAVPPAPQAQTVRKLEIGDGVNNVRMRTRLFPRLGLRLRR